MFDLNGSTSLKLVAVALIFMLGMPPLSAGGPDQSDQVPVVRAAAAPLYPRAALLAHIDGTVRIRVTTDGEKVSSVDVQSGPPILARAAEENLHTWRFDEHTPTAFTTTFEYKLEDPPVCGVQNTTVLLKLPTSIRVTASRVHTCDPISGVQR